MCLINLLVKKYSSLFKEKYSSCVWDMEWGM